MINMVYNKKIIKGLKQNPYTTIFNDQQEEVFTLLDKLTYNKNNSIMSNVDNTELLLIQDIICKYYGNKSRYIEFIKKYKKI